MRIWKTAKNKVYVVHNGRMVSDYKFEKGIVTRNRTAVFAHKHLVVFDNNTQKELFSILGMEIFFFPKVMITKIDGLYGAYSYDNKCILSPKYEAVRVTKHGIIVTKDRMNGFFDFNGKCLHECNIQEIRKCGFDKDYMAVCINYKWGVYKSNFANIIPAKYEGIYFRDCGIIVSNGVTKGVYSYSGDCLLPDEYNAVEEYEDHIIRYRDTTGMWFLFVNSKIAVPGDSIMYLGNQKYIIYILGERRIFNLDSKKYEQPINWEKSWIKQF